MAIGYSMRPLKTRYLLMKLSLLFPGIVLILILSSCNHSNPDRPASAEIMPEKQNINEGAVGVDKKLIKEANLSFETDDIETTAIQVRLIAKAHKAYLDEENRFEYETESGYSMTVRVPETEFDKFLEEVLVNANISKLTNKTIRVNDVTSEYIDVETRLKVKKETEAHYLELLKQAHNLTETMELEKQLSDIRAEIESTEGRMKYLANQVDYSTVHISFTDRKGVTVRFFSEIKSAFKGGWQVFLRFLIGLTYLWVFIPVFFVCRYLFIRIRRNRRSKRAGKIS
jgi:hypothetical protein